MRECLSRDVAGNKMCIRDRLYDHKASFGSEAAEGIELLRSELASYGFTAK